ncbi:MAG TPA: cytochrome c [Gaiellaceae bacterium]|nr:cytochrome c [Gaiellaceae bacterium]
MKVAAIMVLASVALLATACGGSKNSNTTSSTAATTATTTTGSTGTATTPATTTVAKLEKLTGNPILGKKVWVASKCGGCHTLTAAGSTGTIGPDFDYVKPTQADVAGTVESGGDVMPAFPNLSKKQVNDLAAYVYKSTH